MNINSDLQEDVLKALFEAEAKSRVEILRFISIYCDGERCFHPEKMNEGSFSKKLKSMVTISRCYQPDSFVEVSVELSTANIELEE